MKRLILGLLMLSFAPIVAAQVKSANNEITVQTYKSAGVGSVNSHLVIANQGVIVIDAQRVLSEGRKVAEQIKASGKPLVAVILTHNHPDHIGGLAALRQAYPNVPVYATQTTADGIAADTGGYQKLTREALKDDFPSEVPRPDNIIVSGKALTIAGVTFEPADLGAGEAENLTTLFVPTLNVLFSSDLIGHRMTPFLLEEHTGAWIKQLDDAAQKHRQVKTIFPGHGASGKPALLISEQRKYLTRFRAAVAKAVADGAVSADEKQQIVRATERSYPNYLPVAEIPDLVSRNVDAVAKEILSRNQTDAPK